MSKNVFRYVITHKETLKPSIEKIFKELGITPKRRLTFSMQGSSTYETREEAERLLELFRPQLAAQHILTDEEAKTLRVDLVECYHHHDPISCYVDDHGESEP